MLEADDIDPKSMLDWLVKQCICEWCDGTIDDFDCEHNYPITPTRKWRCRTVKHKGYTSTHWKHWLICRKCAGLADFSSWIFPVIGNMTAIEPLAALVDVQPMNQPCGEVFYADYVVGPPAGRPQDVVVLDDDTFRDTMRDRAQVQRLERFCETVLNQELFTRQHIQIDCKITESGASI